MVMDVERQGRLGLWVSILGLALPVLLAMAFTALLERNVLREPLAYSRPLPVAGAYSSSEPWGAAWGITSRSGKTGLFMSLAFLLLLGLVIALTVTVTTVQEGPNEQQAGAGPAPAVEGTVKWRERPQKIVSGGRRILSAGSNHQTASSRTNSPGRLGAS